MKKLDVAAAVLLVIGGLNWGMIGLGGPNIVAALLGEASALSRAVYLLVGLSAVWQALQWKAIQHRWLSRPRAAVAAAALALFAVSPLQAQVAAENAMEPGTIVEAAVAGRISAADLKARADKDRYVTLKTVQGGNLRIHLAGSTVHVGEKFANITAADIVASNGVIHVIDAVLLPGK